MGRSVWSPLGRSVCRRWKLQLYITFFSSPLANSPHADFLPASTENSSHPPSVAARTPIRTRRNDVRPSPKLQLSDSTLHFSFKRSKTPLEFPLLACFFIRPQKISAARRILLYTQQIL